MGKCSSYSSSKKIFCRANRDYHSKSNWMQCRDQNRSWGSSLKEFIYIKFLMYLWIREHCIRWVRQNLGARLPGNLLAICCWTALCNPMCPLLPSLCPSSLWSSIWKESFHSTAHFSHEYCLTEVQHTRSNQLYIETYKTINRNKHFLFLSWLS